MFPQRLKGKTHNYTMEKPDNTFNHVLRVHTEDWGRGAGADKPVCLPRTPRVQSHFVVFWPKVHPLYLMRRKHQTTPNWGMVFKITYLYSFKNVNLKKAEELYQTKETWQVNATHGPGLDPSLEGGKEVPKRYIAGMWQIKKYCTDTQFLNLTTIPWLRNKHPCC